MKKRSLLALLLFLLLTGLCACQPGKGPEAASKESSPRATESTAPGESSSAEQPEFQDYAAALSLDLSSSTLKTKVTVKTFVDGDTTHFWVPESVDPSGVLKARYLGVNTPESTGKVEEYGKTAALFTREKLENAAEILIESDDESWNRDSTGERCLVWVWYKAEPKGPYRNLNLELLQNGLAIANSSGNNRYGEICTQAILQARTYKLAVYSGEKDPNFYYGEAQELTLKEIRLHPEAYEGSKVAFEGAVARGSEGTVYVEAYDPEWDIYFGIPVYLGYGLSGDALDIMSVGNLVRVVGTLQYYEAGGIWQISGIGYRAMKPNDPGNVKKLGEGYEAACPLTAPELFAEGFLEDPETGERYPYRALVMDSTIAMEGLLVKSCQTTTAEDSASKGAFTLVCEGSGVSIRLRTVVLKNPDGSLVQGEDYVGKVLNVKGIVSYYNGEYQIRIIRAEDMEIQP